MTSKARPASAATLPPRSYESVRHHIDRGLTAAERRNAPIEDVIEDLARSAILLGLPLIGPEATIAGLTGLTRQLEELFPEAAERARSNLLLCKVRGTA
ncbi:MAG: hypothetical protein EWM45_04790 [Rhodopseudomonas palustris]|nr:MAG: hypothetical protein EWM45_04790 [Rhodopseudomonas palustris]